MTCTLQSEGRDGMPRKEGFANDLACPIPMGSSRGQIDDSNGRRAMQSPSSLRSGCRRQVYAGVCADGRAGERSSGSMAQVVAVLQAKRSGPKRDAATSSYDPGSTPERQQPNSTFPAGTPGEPRMPTPRIRVPIRHHGPGPHRRGTHERLTCRRYATK